MFSLSLTLPFIGRKLKKRSAPKMRSVIPEGPAEECHSHDDSPEEEPATTFMSNNNSSTIQAPSRPTSKATKGLKGDNSSSRVLRASSSNMKVGGALGMKYTSSSSYCRGDNRMDEAETLRRERKKKEKISKDHDIQEAMYRDHVTIDCNGDLILICQSCSSWIKDEERLACRNCSAAFSVFIRRHHCRSCGE